MISAIYQSCFTSNNVKSTTPCKISMVVFELLLVGGGFGLYFSGVGVIPASILWGAPLLIEVSMLIFICNKNVRQAQRVRDIEEVITKSTELSDIWEFLTSRDIVSFDKSLASGGIVLQNTRYIPPSCDGVFYRKALLNPDLSVACGAYEKNAVTPNDESYYDASKTFYGIIIAAGPKDVSSSDLFLKMVNESGAHTIVMATECVENRVSDNLDLEKTQVCMAYWKDRDDESHQKGLVKFRNFTYADHQIKQYYFEGWHLGHHIEPKRIYAYTQACLEEVGERPIVVHDDSGLGRAGVFAICLILHQLHNEIKAKGLTATIDLQKLLSLLRNNTQYGRYGLINDLFQNDDIISFAEYLQKK